MKGKFPPKNAATSHSKKKKSASVATKPTLRTEPKNVANYNGRACLSRHRKRAKYPKSMPVFAISGKKNISAKAVLRSEKNRVIFLTVWLVSNYVQDKFADHIGYLFMCRLQLSYFQRCCRRRQISCGSRLAIDAGRSGRGGTG